MNIDMISFGIILIIAGFFVLLIGSLIAGKGETKVAIGGFIGPFPFGWGNSPELLKIILIASAVMMIVLILFLN